MSRSSRVMPPMPLRTSVGAMWEMIPPAPTHSTEALENAAWSNPGMSRCRSSAPAMALPTSSIEVLETVNARRMLVHSLPVDFNVNVLVHADEPDEPVPAENGHDRHVAGTLQPFLEILINT